MTETKDEGLIAAEADFLNTQLRTYYGDQHQVGISDDWRNAIQQLVWGVSYQKQYEFKTILLDVHTELQGAIAQMIDTDDKIICNRVRRGGRNVGVYTDFARKGEEWK